MITGGTQAPGEDRIGKSGGTAYRKAAEQRVRGRYTTDSKGQRTYHAPEESTTYGPEGGRSVPVKPTEASRFPNKRY